MPDLPPAIVSFEESNCSAYTLTLRIEVVLRECLKCSMKTDFGEQWQRRIPGDLLKTIRESQTEENRPQFGFLRLGPLYYLTLGELLTLLRQSAGRSVADRFGGKGFLEQLENILTPRNALSHSRPLPSAGLKAIEALYAQMEAVLTPKGLAQIVASPDTGVTQEEVTVNLAAYFNRILSTLSDLPAVLPVPDIFPIAKNQFWWSNNDLAGFDRTPVESAISQVVEYNALSTGVGSAGARQRFCDERAFAGSIRDAITELEKAV